MAFLADKGFEVTAVDFSQGAITYLKNTLKEKNLSCQVLHKDFFSLDDSHDGVYDLVLEQTFFCAIAPPQRKDYVQKVSRVLKPEGMLIGLFYHTDKEGGPPFNTSYEDTKKKFLDLYISGIKVSDLINKYNLKIKDLEPYLPLDEEDFKKNK